MVHLRSLYNLYFSPKKQFARQLRALLGFTPGVLSLYELAFTHSSASSEVGENNERLELLGDSVLNLIIAHYLYRKYPYRKEGFISEMRSKIVSRKKLNDVAKKLDLEYFITTNIGKSSLQKSSTLGNAFEALIGAIYLDKGYRTTLKFTKVKLLQIHIDLDHLEQKIENFKSIVLHYAQTNELKIDFKLLEEKQDTKGKIFVCGVFLDNEEYGRAEDFNKKRAEQAASQIAVKKLNLIP